MLQLLAETPKDQQMIDRLQRAFEQLKKHLDDRIADLEKGNRDLREENDSLRKELEEYRKRHPATVGVKNGKAYVISEESKGSNEIGSRKPGAQSGHEGYSRKLPAITDRIEIHLSMRPYPRCTFSRQGGIPFLSAWRRGSRYC